MNLVRTTTINPTAFVSTTHHPEWWVLVRLQLNCIRRTRFSVDFVARMAEQWESECRVSAEMNTWNENRAYCRTVDVCDCGYRCHFNLSEISNQLQVATRSKEEDSSQYINSFFSVLFFVVFSECFFFFRFFLFFHFCCNLILKSRLTGVTSINWFYPSTAMATTRCVRFRIFISLVFVHCVFFFCLFSVLLSIRVICNLYCLSFTVWNTRATVVTVNVDASPDFILPWAICDVRRVRNRDGVIIDFNWVFFFCFASINCKARNKSCLW